MTAVSLIDEDNHVLARVMAFRQLRCRMKLGDDREDDPLLAVPDALREVAPGADLCLLAFLLGGDSRAEGSARKKRLGKLIFQVDPVCDDNDAAFLQAVVQQKRLA